jgi:hypothetical protein
MARRDIPGASDYGKILRHPFILSLKCVVGNPFPTENSGNRPYDGRSTGLLPYSNPSFRGPMKSGRRNLRAGNRRHLEEQFLIASS